MTHRTNRRRIFGAGVALALSVAAIGAAGVADAGRGNSNGNVPDHAWVPTWATANKAPVIILDAPIPMISNTTLRQVVRVSAGGRSVRVWLTNEFGTAPLTVGEARVALRGHGSSIDAGSDHALTFGGSASVTIAAGERVVSDPVNVRVGNRGELAISLHLPDDVSASGSPVSYHVRALQTNYLAPGNQAGADDLTGASTVPSWFFLAGVDVAANPNTPVVAAIGDSITDGDQAAASEPVDLNQRYTDYLAERLLSTPGTGHANGRTNGAVINLGISGNQVSDTLIGPSLESRFNAADLASRGVTHVVVQGGINDIGLAGLLNTIGIAGFFGPDPRPEIPAVDIIAALDNIAAEARAAGLVVVGTTLSPAGTSGLPGYFGPVAETKRQEVNEWIRTTDAFDLVVDFDQLLADLADATALNPALGADGLHPNAAGYEVMANAVYEALFG